jgi:hypothetical protein
VDLGAVDPDDRCEDPSVQEADRLFHVETTDLNDRELRIDANSELGGIFNVHFIVAS